LKRKKKRFETTLLYSKTALILLTPAELASSLPKDQGPPGYLSFKLRARPKGLAHTSRRTQGPPGYLSFKLRARPKGLAHTSRRTQGPPGYLSFTLELLLYA